MQADPPDPAPVPETPPLLSARDLHIVTGANITLDVADGEVHCISGPSGSGKTLLLRALADLDEAGGEVRLRGEARESFRPCDWRRQVMLSPAQPRWWLETAGEHLKGEPGFWAEALRLSASRLTAPIEQLSTGEQSRCGLLRALSYEPTVLLLDEPTGALDSASIRAVEGLLLAWLKASLAPDSRPAGADRSYMAETGAGGTVGAIGAAGRERASAGALEVRDPPSADRSYGSDDRRQRTDRAIVWVTHDTAQIERVGMRHWRMDAEQGLLEA